MAAPMAARLGLERPTGRPGSLGSSLTGEIGRWAAWLAALLVASTLLGIWLISGVQIGDIARFLAFEALYVLLPGCLLYLLLCPGSSSPPSRLQVLSIGWPLGYALEVGAFALTAELHARGAFAFLPLLALLALGPCVLYRRRRAPAGGVRWRGVLGAGAESLLGAGAIAVALALVAFRFFATYPLPERASSVFYFLDNVEHLSLAAEALHHWPITEPFLAGHPFRYYVGVFIHVAAIKQVTGVPLAIGIFRLLPAMTVLVAALQFWCLGGLLGRSRWAGPVTVALLIVVENMKLYPTHTKVFGVALFSEFSWSPTYGFGIIFLLGLLILFRAHILGNGAAGSPVPSALGAEGTSALGPPAPPTAVSRSGPVNNSSPLPARAGSTPPGAAGSLVILGVLVLGGSTVKTTAIATFVGGLGLLWLWRLLTSKLDRLLSYCLILSCACFLAMYYLLLSGASGPATTETEFAPLNFLKYTVFGSTLATHPGLAPLLAAAVVMFLWKLLPVAGAVWPQWRGRVRAPYLGLALAVFAVGFVVYTLLGSPDDNETYFIWYGYVAIIPVAGVSVVAVWSGLRAQARRAIVRACAGVMVLGLVIAGATQALDTGGAFTGGRPASWYLWYGGTFALAGVTVVLWSMRLERNLAPRMSSRALRAAACGVLLLGVLGCAKSVVLAAPQTWRTLVDEQAVPRDSPSQPGMTAAIYRGLVWVREHTGRCDVLAANTHDVRAVGATKVDSEYFYYSAFTERRVLLESWIVTAQGERGEQPYQALYALNSAATLHGNPAAVRELARMGVSYILIDRTHGGSVREPSSVSRLVFDNGALAVYRMTTPVGAHGC